MILYDDTDNYCTTRVAEIWSRCDYFPGAIPMSQFPDGTFYLTKKNIQNKIIYIRNGKKLGEYYGTARLFIEQNSFFTSMYGWLRILPPFSIVSFFIFTIKQLVAKQEGNRHESISV